MRYRIRSALITISAGMLLGGGAALAESLACKADLTGNGVVNFGDLAVLKAVFFQSCSDPGPRCGDALAQGPMEKCDDGNLRDGDGCSSTCTIEVPLPLVCGDGIAQGPTETCDDGNLTNGDGCSATCAIESPITIGGSAVVATGQTTCWSSGGDVIPCAGTGHDGEIQAGATLAYVDNGDGTITDLNTGLMWEKLSNNRTIHDWNDRYTWADAFTRKIATLNGGGGFAGHTDWRVPNYKELISIVNLQNVSPAVSPVFHTDCVPGATVLTGSCMGSTYYWSSSSYILTYTTTDAWIVDFALGLVSGSHKGYTYSVRAVRGGL